MLMAALPLLSKTKCNGQLSSALPFADTNVIILQFKKKGKKTEQNPKQNKNNPQNCRDF